MELVMNCQQNNLNPIKEPQLHAKCPAMLRIEVRMNLAKVIKKFNKDQYNLKELHQLLGKSEKNKAISKGNVKMPGRHFSSSAYFCQTGSILMKKKDTPCSKCYATRGNYATGNNIKGNSMNSLAIEYYQNVVQSFDLWTFALIKLIEYHAGKTEYIKDAKGNIIGIVDPLFFRFHDAGDVQSLQHLEAINNIAVALPHVNFWLPTRELTYVKEFFDKHGLFASNLVVRQSQHKNGKKPFEFSKYPQLLTSTVSWDEGSHNCPALTQYVEKWVKKKGELKLIKQFGVCEGIGLNGKHNSCRNCWDSKITNINYTLH
tara:strand:+ start:589 stop:1536 length:948 start_codon:yes stop_codon:yes gene_type:complete